MYHNVRLRNNHYIFFDTIGRLIHSLPFEFLNENRENLPIEVALLIPKIFYMKINKLLHAFKPIYEAYFPLQSTSITYILIETMTTLNQQTGNCTQSNNFLFSYWSFRLIFLLFQYCTTLNYFLNEYTDLGVTM